MRLVGHSSRQTISLEGCYRSNRSMVLHQDAAGSGIVVQSLIPALNLKVEPQEKMSTSSSTSAISIEASLTAPIRK
jgi:hypothetical protein